MRLADQVCQRGVGRSSQGGKVMKKKGTKRAKKRGRQSDLLAKAARSVKGGPVDIRGGATDSFAKIGNIKGECFSVDIGTSERLKW